LGMPIIDTLTVMIKRLLARQSPFKADRRHIHHRLLVLGFNHREAVCLLYLLQGLLFVTAWFLRFESDLRVLLAFAAFTLVVLVSLHAAEHLNLRFHQPAANGRPPRAEPHRTRAKEGASWAAGFVLKATLGCFAIWVVLYGGRPSNDLRWFALL